MLIRKIIFLFSFFQTLSLSAQVIRINQDWLFQRLKSTVTHTTIENQGTTWESQYNVTHTSVSEDLKVPADILSNELNVLQTGEWETVNLPHTAHMEDLVVLHQWQGVCYYKKIIGFDPVWKNKKIWMEFEGAMQLADVWVNGNHVTQHAGGYTPFVVDLTPFLYADIPNEIIVRLDNNDNPLIPPGKPVSTLDFCYYGGIYRNVNLIIKPQDVYISHPIMADKIAGGGVFVTYPDISDSQATAHIKTHVMNDSGTDRQLTVRQKLYEMNGRNGELKKGKQVVQIDKQILLNAGKGDHPIQELTVIKPRLWSPDEPNLYLLQTEITENGKVLDQQVTRIGIRHIEFSKEKGFVLNGEQLRLVGSNRHMEYPYIGNALPDNAQYRDIYQIKECGFNVVRLGHYPQSVSVLDACDELGLLVIEPIPGWQFFNKDDLFTHLTYRDIRNMIRRDRNHPSVIMWETTLNESWPPESWKDAAVKVAHEEYPGDQCYTAGDGYGYDGFDVVYNDWKEGFQRPNPGTKAGFIREYYDYEFGGHYSTTRITRVYGEKALLQNAWNAQWSHNRYRNLYPKTAGDAIWSMYDYNRGCCDNICYSGVADIFRLPKFSLHFFNSQLKTGTPLPSGMMNPYLFIANYWTQRGENDDTVIVYGNVDEVELRINGRTIARNKPDNGVDSDYIENADGGNCRNLSHPPFTFRNIDWEKGTIEAVGYVAGKIVVTQKRFSPEKPDGLKVSYFESGKKASKNDILIVYVEIIDKNSTLCVDENEAVTLSVREGGEIIGPEVVNAAAGIASFLVKTGDAGQLKMNASFSAGETSVRYKLTEK